MRISISIIIYILITAGLHNIGLSWINAAVASCLLLGTYISLWYKELANMEQEYQKNIMHEDRIPVIGEKPIDWDEYCDIPKLDINAPLIFDRNKIYHEPKKPL